MVISHSSSCVVNVSSTTSFSSSSSSFPSSFSSTEEQGFLSTPSLSLLEALSYNYVRPRGSDATPTPTATTTTTMKTWTTANESTLLSAGKPSVPLMLMNKRSHSTDEAAPIPLQDVIREALAIVDDDDNDDDKDKDLYGF